MLINEAFVDDRQFPRLNIRCRARIRIGNREYAGFVQNLSEGGARFATLTAVRGSGPVLLKMPDLPARWGTLCWTESHGGGVSFRMNLDGETLSAWAHARVAGVNSGEDASSLRTTLTAGSARCRIKDQSKN